MGRLKVRTVAKTVTVSVLFPDGIFVGIPAWPHQIIVLKTTTYIDNLMVSLGTILPFTSVVIQFGASEMTSLALELIVRAMPYAGGASRVSLQPSSATPTTSADRAKGRCLRIFQVASMVSKAADVIFTVTDQAHRAICQHSVHLLRCARSVYAKTASRTATRTGAVESGSAIVRIVKDSITAGRIFCGIRISRIGWEDN